MTGSIATKTNAKGETLYYAVMSAGVDPDTKQRKRAWYGPFKTEEEAHKERHAVSVTWRSRRTLLPSRSSRSRVTSTTGSKGSSSDRLPSRVIGAI